MGFSGYNTEFNANAGVYRLTLNRETGVNETKKVESLYQKILPVIKDKNVVVFTHMPLKDWCSNAQHQKDIVYVSGHTHRNYFYDDGDIRVYADNQVGYRKEQVCLKSFLLNSEYDIFTDYLDGIYEIDRQQYQDFYRGKNISITFKRRINIYICLRRMDTTVSFIKIRQICFQY